MKLFSKYNRINLLSTVAIFIMGSILFSLLIHYIVRNQIDEDLNTERSEVLTYVQQYHNMPQIENTHDQYTIYNLIKPLPKPVLRYYTQERYNVREHEKEAIRSVEFDVSANGAQYLVTVSKSLEVTENLIQSIVIITIILILLILLTGILINRVVLQRLWQPFYNTIATIQQFKLSDAIQISFEKNNIDEFNLMNSTLQDALNKAQHDYRALKEFTENASHELQTPLAIIRSKLDLLIQDEKLSRLQSEIIKSAYDALQNLKKMNQSLLLLAKIENNQFSEKASANMATLLREKTNQFYDLWKARNMVVSINTTESTITGNVYLINILLNNLLSNATKHNRDNGVIKIILQDSLLQIENTSVAGSLDKTRLFNRFSGQKNSEINHGLGLAISRQICELSGYIYDYKFANPDRHIFIIRW